MTTWLIVAPVAVAVASIVIFVPTGNSALLVGLVKVTVGGVLAAPSTVMVPDIFGCGRQK